MRESMSVWVSLYIVERRCRVSLFFSSTSTFTRVYQRTCLSLHAHSLHANISTRLSTWLSYALSRLRSRLRCLLRHHRLRHQHLHKSLPSKGSVDVETTACNDPSHKHAWIHSLMTTFTKHPRKPRRRTEGSAASVKNSSNESDNFIEV